MRRREATPDQSAHAARSADASRRPYVGAVHRLDPTCVEHRCFDKGAALLIPVTAALDEISRVRSGLRARGVGSSVGHRGIRQALERPVSVVFLIVVPPMPQTLFRKRPSRVTRMGGCVLVAGVLRWWWW